MEVVTDVGRPVIARFSDDTFQELSHYIDIGDALGMLARGLPEPVANRGAEGEANVISVSVTRRSRVFLAVMLGRISITLGFHC